MKLYINACQFNDGVDCDGKNNCDNCGWNPVVQERRKSKLRGMEALVDEIHEVAVNHGWWDKPVAFPTTVALCHAELSEALEAYRNDDPLYYLDEKGKPDGVAVEMADCIIRILDWAGHEKIDIGKIIEKKTAYNRKRPYRHGGKRC